MKTITPPETREVLVEKYYPLKAAIEELLLKTYDCRFCIKNAYKSDSTFSHKILLLHKNNTPVCEINLRGVVPTVDFMISNDDLLSKAIWPNNNNLSLMFLNIFKKEMYFTLGQRAGYYGRLPAHEEQLLKEDLDRLWFNVEMQH